MLVPITVLTWEPSVRSCARFGYSSDLRSVTQGLQLDAKLPCRESEKQI